TDDVAKVIVGRGAKAMNADITTLYAADESASTLTLIGEAGVAEEVLSHIRIIDETSRNPVHETLKNGKALWVESEEEYLALYPALAKVPAKGPRAKSFWSFPLNVENAPIGLLGMGFYDERSFAPDERVFIETFAGHCAQALRRAQR